MTAREAPQRIVAPESPAAREAPADREPGVNVVGYFEVESGLGEVARRLARVLEASGVRFSAIPYRDTFGRKAHPHGLILGSEAPYDTNLVCLSADDLARFGAEAGSDFFARRYSIGVWFWETDVFRAEDLAATRFLDELWVASDYVRGSLAGAVEIPMHVVPVPVESPGAPAHTRSDLRLPDAFTFLFVFDYWSGERKNPAAVVEAFVSAFAPGEGPVLVLKSINGRDWKPDQFERIAAFAREREDIIVRDGYVSADERDSYIAACDCYVSLHRSEGLGLTMAEAMAYGKPVIATGYSGNLEFMDESSSLLVPYRLVDVPETWWAHAPGATWAEPDVGTAANLMRRVWEHPDDARAIGRAGLDAIVDRFPPGRTAAFVNGRLAEARRRGAVQARTSAHDARPAILDASRLLAEKGLAESLARGHRAAPVSVARRFLRRAFWPQLEDQRRFELAVLEALTTLQRSLDDLEERLVRLENASREAEPPS